MSEEVELFYLTEPGVGKNFITNEIFNFALAGVLIDSSSSDSETNYGAIKTEPQTPNDTIYINGDNTIPFRALIEPSDLNRIAEINKTTILNFLSSINNELESGKFGLLTAPYDYYSKYQYGLVFEQLDSVEELNNSRYSWLLYYQGEDYSIQYLRTMYMNTDFYDQLNRGLSGRNITIEQALNLLYQYKDKVGQVRTLKP